MTRSPTARPSYTDAFARDPRGSLAPVGFDDGDRDAFAVRFHRAAHGQVGGLHLRLPVLWRRRSGGRGRARGPRAGHAPLWRGGAGSRRRGGRVDRPPHLRRDVARRVGRQRSAGAHDALLVRLIGKRRRDDALFDGRRRRLLRRGRACRGHQEGDEGGNPDLHRRIVDPPRGQAVPLRRESLPAARCVSRGAGSSDLKTRSRPRALAR